MRAQTRQNLLFTLILTTLGAFVNIFHTVVDRMSLSIGKEALASGVLLSVYALGSLTSLIASSALADRVGKRPVVGASLLVIALGLILISLSKGAAALYLGLFLFGFGFAPTEGMSSALLGDENPNNASFWMNLAQAGFGLGAIIGPMIAMLYLASNETFHGLFTLIGLLSLIFMVLVFLSARTAGNAVKNTGEKTMNMFSVLKDRRMRFLALTIFLYLGYESVSPAYMKILFLRNGESEALAAGMISLFWGTMILGRLLGTQLTGKESKSIPIFTVFVIIGSLLLITAGNTPLRVLAVGLVGFGCGPVWPMLVLMAVRLFPKRSGAAMGIMMLSSMLGISLFPPLIGALPNNLNVTFILCAVLGSLVILVSTSTIKEEKV